tara:strand:- start:112 stop:378 length:267 start_codon:yes stop_codon:yes gene_type:complete
MTYAITETFKVTLPQADFSELGNGLAALDDMTSWVERRGFSSRMYYEGDRTWEVFMPSSRVGNAIRRFKSFGFTVILSEDSIWFDVGI